MEHPQLTKQENQVDNQKNTGKNNSHHRWFQVIFIFFFLSDTDKEFLARKQIYSIQSSTTVQVF